MLSPALIERRFSFRRLTLHAATFWPRSRFVRESAARRRDGVFQTARARELRRVSIAPNCPPLTVFIHRSSLDGFRNNDLNGKRYVAGPLVRLPHRGSSLNIRKFVGATSRDALRLVREALGPGRGRVVQSHDGRRQRRDRRTGRQRPRRHHAEGCAQASAAAIDECNGVDTPALAAPRAMPHRCKRIRMRAACPMCSRRCSARARKRVRENDASSRRRLGTSAKPMCP